jgi:ABC-type transporter Mla subunit MlaD
VNNRRAYQINYGSFKKPVYLLLALSLVLNIVLVIRAVRAGRPAESGSTDLAAALEHDLDVLEGRIADSLEGVRSLGESAGDGAEANRNLKRAVDSGAGLAAELGTLARGLGDTIERGAAGSAATAAAVGRENDAVGTGLAESLEGIRELGDIYHDNAAEYRTIRDRLERLVGTLDQYLTPGYGAAENLDSK